jgi:hypothetical protein
LSSYWTLTRFGESHNSAGFGFCEGQPKEGASWQAQAICGRDSCVPNFAIAVELHHLVDAIKRASDTGREVYFEE